MWSGAEVESPVRRDVLRPLARKPMQLDSEPVVFEPSHTPGLFAAPLHEDLDGAVALLRFAPGTTIAHHHHPGGAGDTDQRLQFVGERCAHVKNSLRAGGKLTLC